MSGREDNDCDYSGKDGQDEISSSRRRFLKMMGGGMTGLGAFAFMPSFASGLEIHSKFPVQYFNKTGQTPEFEVNNQGDVSAETVSASGVSVDISIGSGKSLRIEADEHAEQVLPDGRAYTVDGELVVDGSFIIQGADM